MNKLWFLICILIFSLNFTGCFTQDNEKIKEKYVIVKNEGLINIVAKENLAGVEVILDGIISENNIKTSKNILKIVKINDGKTIVSVAGEINKNFTILEIPDNTYLFSINIIEKPQLINSIKRAGEVLLGDFDNSSTIDLADFTAFAQSYGTYKAQHDIAPSSKGVGMWADILCIAAPDGKVNLDDFISFAQNYGKKVPISTQNIFESRAFELVNTYRETKGLKKLEWNETVYLQAKEHSKNMADGKTPFGHDGFSARVAKIGEIIKWSSCAENVAYNNGYSDPAQIAVDGWIKSDGHRKNMEGNYKFSAIGVEKNANGNFYFTQIFINGY